MCFRSIFLLAVVFLSCSLELSGAPYPSFFPVGESARKYGINLSVTMQNNLIQSCLLTTTDTPVHFIWWGKEPTIMHGKSQQSNHLLWVSTCQQWEGKRKRDLLGVMGERDSPKKRESQSPIREILTCYWEHKIIWKIYPGVINRPTDFWSRPLLAVRKNDGDRKTIKVM